jgi:hypothetical protein
MESLSSDIIKERIVLQNEREFIKQIICKVPQLKILIESSYYVEGKIKLLSKLSNSLRRHMAVEVNNPSRFSCSSEVLSKFVNLMGPMVLSVWEKDSRKAHPKVFREFFSRIFEIDKVTISWYTFSSKEFWRTLASVRHVKNVSIDMFYVDFGEFKHLGEAFEQSAIEQMAVGSSFGDDKELVYQRVLPIIEHLGSFDSVKQNLKVISWNLEMNCLGSNWSDYGTSGFIREVLDEFGFINTKLNR